MGEDWWDFRSEAAALCKTPSSLTLLVARFSSSCQRLARTILMVFGGWALFRGFSHILGARRANVQNTGRGLTTTTGGAVGIAGPVLMIRPGVPFKNSNPDILMM